ncbi:MAG: hemolysin family protein [bacterium]
MDPFAIRPILEALVILLLVGISGAYTAAETALLTLMRLRRIRAADTDVESGLEEEVLEEEFPLPLGALLDRPGILTATFMLGRLVARVLAVTVTALLAFRWAINLGRFDPFWALVGAVLLSLILLLALAEALPRILGTRCPEGALRWTVPMVRLSAPVFSPATLLLSGILRRFARPDSGKTTFLTTEELRHLLEERQDAGQIEEEDREMIEDLLEFGQTMVREVMVPRIDIVGLPMGADRDTLRELVAETGHSRLPLYDGDIDHVVGIIHAKDLFRIPTGEAVDLRQLARKVSFVPETKMIDDLLREMQARKSHMAIVVDEYGGTAGLATLEDLLEEIVGEIQDEYDRELPMVRAEGRDTWLVNAAISLEELEEQTGIDLPRDGYGTLGGFLYSLEGRVPEEEQVLRHEDMRFEVLQTRERRILEVRVAREGPSGPAAEQRDPP